MARQLELQLNKTEEASPEEAQEWYENHLKPLGDGQLKFIAMMSVLQISSVGLMLLAFWVIDYAIE